MSLDTFVAGRYATTYNAVDVGILEEGVELQQDSKAEVINQSDAFGDSVLDAIYRGGDTFLQWMSKAYKSGSYTPFWPFGPLGQMAAAATPIGRLFSAMAQALVMTATANTPAALAPATLTGSLSLLAPNYSGKLLFNSKLRQVPVRLQLLPSTNTGVTTWFITT